MDAITRPFAEALSRRLGQPFVVENRAGASGAVGTEAAVRATPAAIQDKLARAIAEANADPAVQQRVLQAGFFPMTKTGPELAAELGAQVAEHQDWVKRTGLKIE